MFMIRTIVVVFLLFHLSFDVKGFDVSYNFYEKSCPQVEHIVRNGLEAIFLTDPTSPVALLRLMFQRSGTSATAIPCKHFFSLKKFTYNKYGNFHFSPYNYITFLLLAL